MWSFDHTLAEAAFLANPKFSVHVLVRKASDPAFASLRSRATGHEPRDGEPKIAMGHFPQLFTLRQLLKQSRLVHCKQLLTQRLIFWWWMIIHSTWWPSAPFFPIPFTT